MDSKVKLLLLDIIKYALRGDCYTEERLSAFLEKEAISKGSEEYSLLLSKLYTLSENQDMAHIPAEALSSAKAFDGTHDTKLTELKQRFEKSLMLSVVRFIRIDAELKRISSLFESEGINFIPLKGSVLKFYYKNPKIRTSCDIDILVREEDLARCDRLLTEALKYEGGRKNAHDVSYHSESGVHLELHYSLMESYNGERSEAKLSEAWDYSYPEEGYSHLRRLKGEFFYLYHIAHMAKHFINGGCGVKPYMDIFVMKEASLFDRASADELLLECGLKVFSEVQEELSSVWFSDGSHTDLTQASEDFVFSGGVYGNFDNYIAMHSAKRGSKFKYLLSRIFLSYAELTDVYPSLKGKRILTPIYQIRRFANLIFKKGSAKRSISELKRTAAIDKSKSSKTQEFMKSLELI